MTKDPRTVHQEQLKTANLVFGYICHNLRINRIRTVSLKYTLEISEFHYMNSMLVSVTVPLL